MNKTAGLISASIWLALMVTLAPVAPAQAPNGAKLEATAWAVADSDGGSYVFNFGRGGKISFTSSSGTSGLGTWSRDGSTIHIEVSRVFVKYSGTVEGRRMEGRAKNRRGREWQWWGVRQGASPIASSSAFPRYPPIAKAARAEGVVAVDVEVDAAGTVRAAKAVAGHPLLQQAGAEAARRWKFAPREDAGAVRTVRLLFAFRLLPQDCGRRDRWPEPEPALLSAYQAEVKGRTGCVEYSADRAR
jgi:TonB family protein